MEQYKEIGQGRTGRLLLKYSLPAIAGMMLVTLYNVVDRIFVGQATGSPGLAAVTVAFPFMMLGFAAALLANAGGSSLISRLLGAGDKAGAELALGQSVLIGTVLSGISGLVCLPFLDPVLRLFGASDAILPAARQFSLIMIIAFPFQGAGMGLASGIRSQGKAKTATALMLAGLLVNAGLCGIFVMGLGWGVAGSAWATLIGQAFGCFLSLGFYAGGFGSLRFRLRNLVWKTQSAQEVFSAGSGAWIANAIPIFLFLILNNAMTKVAGDVGLAMIGVVNVVSMFAVMPVIGIMQGAAPILGFNHGAGEKQRVKRVFFQALAASTAVLVFFWLILQLFPDAIIRAFSANDAELIALGKKGLVSYLMSLPIIGLSLALMQYYQSVGKGLQSAVMGMCRQVFFLIPALLIMPNIWGLDGVIWAGPVSDVLGTLLALVFFMVELPRMRAAARKPQIAS